MLEIMAFFTYSERNTTTFFNNAAFIIHKKMKMEYKSIKLRSEQGVFTISGNSNETFLNVFKKIFYDYSLPRVVE